MPTVNLTKKARNLLANPKCCVVVDVLDAGEGKGLVFQGQAKIVFGPAFARLGRTIERLAGWHLDKWEIGGTKPNSIIEFRPERVAEIGRV